MKKHKLLSIAMALLLGCGVVTVVGAARPVTSAGTSPDLPYGAPDFSKIRVADLRTAINEGIAEYEANLKTIRTVKPRKATFENVVCALDDADSTLSRTRSLLNYLRSNFSTDELVRTSVEIAPALSALGDKVAFDTKIFRLIETLHDKRQALGMDSLQVRVIERKYKNYVRNGVLCSAEQQKRLAEINAELSVKRLQHGHNIVKDAEEYVYYVTDSARLDGLSPSTKTRFAKKARALGHPGQWAIGLTNGDDGVVLGNVTDRELRKAIYEARRFRCNRNDRYDNKQLSVDIIDLRREKAQILGYKSYSEYCLENNMAETPARVYELLLPLTRAAIKKGEREMRELRDFAAGIEGAGFELRPWDVSFYSLKLAAELNLKTGDARNYFLFDNVCKGVFYVANSLYGLTFVKRTDIPVYHPEVIVYEVRGRENGPLGLLYLDCFVRPGKRGGAWCSRLRGYSIDRNGIEHMPLITISCNFSHNKDRARLLPVASVKTLFHEFGHALAGFLARGPYPAVTGNFPRDMVELPSQINEHWAWEPQVMKYYARHYKTGEPIPDSLIERIGRANNFQKGIYLTDYYASTLLDLEWHMQEKPVAGCGVEAFETAFLKRYGFPDYTDFRYRTTFFNHMFASSYPSQYYVYTWASVLDTDAFAAFTETGDIFDPQVAERFRCYILTQIGYDEPMTQYIRFRGKAPTPEALIRRNGLAD